MSDRPIYHLVPASYYRHQPQDQPYQPATLALEGFIHCTVGADILIKIANAFFDTLPGELLVLEIDPVHLTVPLRFEPPILPDHSVSYESTFVPDPDILFPHIYGPLNREAIVACFALRRDETGRWQMPK